MQWTAGSDQRIPIWEYSQGMCFYHQSLLIGDEIHVFHYKSHLGIIVCPTELNLFETRICLKVSLIVSSILTTIVPNIRRCLCFSLSVNCLHQVLFLKIYYKFLTPTISRFLPDQFNNSSSFSNNFVPSSYTHHIMQ